MKVRCTREGLLAGVQLASVAVPSKDVKPVLRHIKTIAAADRCTLLATDLELGVRLDIVGVQVDEPGEALLPASRTLAILRESPDAEVSIEADVNGCVVRGQHNEFEMPGDDPAHFPEVPSFDDVKFHEMVAGGLRDMIRRTVFAAAAENPRYALTGVLWELEGDSARLVATDGRRLAVTAGKATAHGGQDTKGQTHVVPTKAMGLLERLLQDPDETVRICLRPNEAMFKTERALLYTRLVEGRYPPYRDVIPKKQTIKVPITVGTFYAAVRQAAIMTDDESKRVSFTFDQGKLTLQAKGPKTGRSKVELPIEYTAKKIEINFDPKYMSDMLRIVEAEDQMTLELIDGQSVAMFKGSDGYVYVVMPLT